MIIGSFWQGPRKVIAIPLQAAGELGGKRKLSADQTGKSSSDVDSFMVELKKMREDITKLRESKDAESSANSPVPLSEKGVRDFLVRVFRCNICFEVSTLPTAACSKCENVIGCIPCVEQWRQDEDACPLCRFQGEYNTVPKLRAVQEVLNAVTREIGESTEPSDGEFSNLGAIQVENEAP